MVNDFTKLSAESPEDSLAKQTAEELPYDGAGFPGCGDGSDDLADYNQMEASDYDNE